MHIIHPSEIQSLRSELMSSTALTPTQHKKGGGFKAIIGIAAAVAIPFAAPIIAKAIGLSAVLGSAMAGGAIVGGVLGGAAAYATGQNPLIGIAGGAIGGGIAGAAQGPGIAGDMGFGASPQAVTTGVGNTALSPATQGVVGGGPGLTSAVTEMTSAQMGQAFDPYAGFVPGAPGSGVVMDQIGAAGVAEQLSGAGTGIDQYTAYTGGSINPDQTPYTGGTWAGPGTPAPAATPAATQAGVKTFGDRVGDFFSGDMPKFGAIQAGSKLLGNVMAGEPEQTELEKAQLAALQSARAEQGALQADKTKKADAFYRQAQNLNPDFYGRMAMADEQNRKKRAEAAGLRGIRASDTGARAAAQQRAALRTAKLGSFDKARADAEAKRMGLMQSAISAHPTGKGYADSRAADLKASDAPYRRMLGERADWQDVAGNVGKGFFELSDDEIKKRGAAIT